MNNNNYRIEYVGQKKKNKKKNNNNIGNNNRIYVNRSCLLFSLAGLDEIKKKSTNGRQNKDVSN